jgi:thiamine-monophosphate kinase
VARTEDQLIAWLRHQARGAGGERIGDDAALLPPGGPWAATVDCQIEGVHFLPRTDPLLIARRLLAVNLSDLAAVGARPRFALLALAAPVGFDHHRLLAGLVAACRRHRVELVGGDLARAPLVAGILTLIGCRPPGGRWVRRSAARPGDVLWLGGRIGQSGAGREVLRRGARWQGRRVVLPEEFCGSRRLAEAARRAVRRHLAPEPQLELGAWLGRQRRAAAIDVSDGLALDLDRLCRESGVGAKLDASRLIDQRDSVALAHHLGRDPLTLALAGGEDYVLLFALPAGCVPPTGFGCRRIGTIEAEPGLFLDRDGRRRRLAAAGWDHLS